MHYVWQSLLWKEWHEHKWRLAALWAIAISVPLFSIWRDPTADASGLVAWILFIGAPAALFIAMGTAAGERAGGTSDFLRSLPVAPGKVLAVKLLVGAATTLLATVPVVVLPLVWALARAHGAEGDAGLTEIMIGGGATHDGVWVTLAFVAAVCMIFLWATAAGAGQPTELRAGIAGVTVMVAWVALIALTQGAPSSSTWGTSAAHPLQFIYWSSPLGLFVDADMPGSPTPVVIGCQLLMAIALVTWLRFQFTRVSEAGNRSPTAEVMSTISRARAIAAPFRNRLGALSWQHRHELLPSVVVGGVLIASVAVITPNSLQGDEPQWTFLKVKAVLHGIAELLAIIVGVGMFVTGLKPAILGFWRSRPISPTAWFWTRYLTGAVAVLLILDGPFVAMLGFPELRGRLLAESYVLVVPPLYHLVTYTVAVCLACLLRQAFYAGIITLGFVIGTDSALWIDSRLAWISPGQVMTAIRVNGSSDLLLPFVLAMMGITIVFTLIAWQAVRFDFGLTG